MHTDTDTRGKRVYCNVIVIRNVLTLHTEWEWQQYWQSSRGGIYVKNEGESDTRTLRGIFKIFIIVRMIFAFVSFLVHKHNSFRTTFYLYEQSYFNKTFYSNIEILMATIK